MPATSEKQRCHLEEINILPQVKSRRFYKGMTPWNKGTKVMITLKCQFCGKEFQIPQAQVKREAHRAGRFCSKKCFYEAKNKYGRRAEIKELYDQGKTLKEIGKTLGILPSSVASMIYRMKIANRFGGRDAIFSSAYRVKVKDLLKESGIKKCELCGYDRTTDIAHVIERKNGGEYLLNNCILLCPNCHHLFDHKLLTQDEKNKLLGIKRLNGDLKRRLQ